MFCICQLKYYYFFKCSVWATALAAWHCANDWLFQSLGFSLRDVGCSLCRQGNDGADGSNRCSLQAQCSDWHMRRTPLTVSGLLFLSWQCFVLVTLWSSWPSFSLFAEDKAGSEMVSSLPSITQQVRVEPTWCGEDGMELPVPTEETDAFVDAAMGQSSGRSLRS